MADDEKEEQQLEPLDRRREHFLRDFFENSELYTFGIITQKGYKDLEDRLADHARTVQDRFHRWFVVGLLAYGIIALSSTIGLIGFGVLLDRQSQATADIQQQRRESINRTCTDQNQRHDTTVNALNKALHDAETKAKTKKQKEKLRQSAQVSIGLIDALVPHQDCDQVVLEATG